LFEPVSIYHPTIREVYGSMQHELIPCAVSNVDKEVFLVSLSSDFSGAITHAQITDEAPKRRELPIVAVTPIQSIRLDSFFKDKELPRLQYLIKIDVDGCEEKIIDGAYQCLQNASFVIVEAPITSLLARASKLMRLGFSLYDICDHAYYFRQLSQVDLVFINTRLVSLEPRFDPWSQSSGKVDWAQWQHLSEMPH
jgi:FkbM family methyltransferase